MNQSDKDALARYCLPKAMRLYPGLFKQDYTKSHSPYLELMDQNITDLYFSVSHFGENVIYLKTYCSKYEISLSLKTVMGDFTNYTKNYIPDSSCVGLFNINIDVKQIDHQSGKIKYCDRVAVRRRHIINEIINND